jgi:hypothetical protein
MGKLKEAMLNGYAYTPDYDYGYDKRLVADAAKGIKALRNDRQHWHENMPDLTGQALADAQDAFDEADDMPLWIQLELDLWEGQHGINEQTYWDMAGRGSRG